MRRSGSEHVPVPAITSMTKRLLDMILSSAGLLLLSPILVVCALIVKASSRGPAVFVQVRVGRGFRPFRIFKFRSMVQDAPQVGRAITVGADPRITRIGRVLRATKLDELPQLFNVLKGDMSLVGPRPEAPKYVEMFRKEYEEILRVRPGISDLASIKYRDEAAVLAQADDPEEAYVSVVLPEKIRLAKEYIRRSSILFDLYLIFLTIAKIASDRCAAPPVDSVDVPAAKS